MGTSKISVDLVQRTFDIEVPDENVADVLGQLSQLFEKLPAAALRSVSDAEASADPIGEATSDIANAKSDEEDKSKRKRSVKGASKVRAYQLIDLGLTQQQRQDMQKFYQDKGPQGQNDQVAVLSVKLKELTGRSEFTADEVHSAFKVVNKPTPKNLVAVMGNMKRDGKAGYTDSKLVVNSFTEDHVQFYMEKTTPKENK